MADLITNANLGVPLVEDVSTNFASGGMTALRLLQELKRKCGVTGQIPTTVVGQTGDMERLFGYVNEAWMEIQRLHSDWEFMRQPISFVTTANVGRYSAAQQGIDSFDHYKGNSFTIYPVGEEGRECELPFMEYDDFRRRYLFGSARSDRKQPEAFSVTPQRDLILGPVPNGQYRIEGECYALPAEFTASEQRPSMPAKFHWAIVYLAMTYYGLYEGAPEVHGDGMTQYNRIIAKLAIDQLPRIGFGPPLA